MTINEMKETALNTVYEAYFEAFKMKVQSHSDSLPQRLHNVAAQKAEDYEIIGLLNEDEVRDLIIKAGESVQRLYHVNLADY